MVYTHAYFNILLLLHSAFMLCVVKMLDNAISTCTKIPRVLANFDFIYKNNLLSIQETCTFGKKTAYTLHSLDCCITTEAFDIRGVKRYTNPSVYVSNHMIVK